MARNIENLLILALVVGLVLGGALCFKGGVSPAGKSMAGGFSQLNSALAGK